MRQPTVPSARPPLIVLLHGVGGNERNLFHYAAVLPPEYLVIAARAPLVKGIDSFAWFSVRFELGKPVINPTEAESSRIMLWQFITWVIEKYNIDNANVYLAGFSQGAIMCYSVALTHPGLIKGIAALSGRVLPEIKPLVKPSEALCKLRVLISHGVEDNKLGRQYARDAREYVESLHIPLTYIEWPDTGHMVTYEMMGTVADWMQK
jgi:phospholipase/carboxylesterase